MIKKLCFWLIVSLFSVYQIRAQKYITRTGNTQFKASKEAFEPIEAINKSTSVIFKIDTGDIAAQLFISAFQFKVALMQEHFNENYMESDLFPKATFTGKLNNFSINKINEINTYFLEGSLTIRGIQKKVNSEVFISFKNDNILLKTKLIVKPEDFNIKIPSIVNDKIAKDIYIDISYELSEKI